MNNQIVEAELQTIIAEIGESIGSSSYKSYSVTKGHNEYYSDGPFESTFGNQVIVSEIPHRHLVNEIV